MRGLARWEVSQEEVRCEWRCGRLPCRLCRAKPLYNVHVATQRLFERADSSLSNKRQNKTTTTKHISPHTRGTDFIAYGTWARERNMDTSLAHKLSQTSAGNCGHLLHSNRNWGASLMSANAALLRYPLQTVLIKHWLHSNIFKMSIIYILQYIIYICI